MIVAPQAVLYLIISCYALLNWSLCIPEKKAVCTLQPKHLVYRDCQNFSKLILEHLRSMEESGQVKEATSTNKPAKVKTQNKSQKRKIKTETNLPSKSEVPAKKLKTENTSDSKVIKTEKTKNKTTTSADKSVVSWKEDVVISESVGIFGWAAKNVVKLLDGGCTIPFIARYRKEQTGGMDVQKLRETLSVLEELRFVIM